MRLPGKMTSLAITLMAIVLLIPVEALGLDGRIEQFEKGLLEISFSNEGVHQTESRSPLLERMQYYRCPGVGLTLVDNNEIAWSKGYGVKSVDTSAPLDEKSVFQAGSVSKFVTALIAMHYVEQGELDLDTDINRYLNSWKMPTNAYGKAITLRQLLSHQSGLPGTNFDHESGETLPTLPQILSAEAPALNRPAIPVSEPEAGWSYSNIGYVVVQLILEDLLQRPLQETARELLFEPLEMNSSSFDYPLPEQLRKHEVMPHDETGAAREPAQDSRARAQGGLLTTTEDMAKLLIEFMDSLEGRSDRIISQEWALRMITGEVAIPAGVFGFELEMGLGALVQELGDQSSFLHAGQSWPGSSFLFVAFPGSRQAVVMGVNGRSGDQLQLEILATLAQLYDYPGGQYFKKP